MICEEMPTLFVALNEMAEKYDLIEDWDHITKRQLAEHLKFQYDVFQMIVPQIIANQHAIKLLDKAMTSLNAIQELLDNQEEVDDEPPEVYT